MKILNLLKSIQNFFVVAAVLVVTVSAEAIPAVPEARIQCSGYFQAHVLFAHDFSVSGPKLNKFAGRARAVGNGSKDFEVRGHQVQRAKYGDAVFWIFTLKSGTFSADVVLTQVHDWQSTAYGEISLPNGKKESLSCLVLVDLNGVDQRGRPTHNPR